METPTIAVQLRSNMVDALCRAGHVTSERIRHAFRAVPRHCFLPRVWLPADEVPVRFVPHSLEEGNDFLRQIYSDASFVTKVSSAGFPLSSTTAPSLMARMLESLRVEPGMRIWEIGTGTGYNAALLSVLAAPGLVYTTDISHDIVREARERLIDCGFGSVEVRQGDAFSTGPPGCDWDRILLTAGFPGVLDCWITALTDGGRFVGNWSTPFGGATIALERSGHDRASGFFPPGPNAGFLPLRGKHVNPRVRFIGPAPAVEAGMGVSQLPAYLGPSSPAPHLPSVPMSLALLISCYLPDLRTWTEEKEGDEAGVVACYARPTSTGVLRVAKRGEIIERGDEDVLARLLTAIAQWECSQRAPVSRYSLLWEREVGITVSVAGD